MTIYTDNGYADREDYLKCLAEDYDISLEDLKVLALDEEEDFDSLITMLEDNYS